MEPHDYKVTKIEGEYATLTDINTGDELFIALFLLPDGIDIGTQLHYENLCYEITEECHASYACRCRVRHDMLAER